MKAKIKTERLAGLIIPVVAVIMFACGENMSEQKEATAEKQDQANEFSVQNGDTIWSMADRMPVFKGGDSLLLKYISENIVYPAEAKNNGVQGKVIVKFCIDKTGVVGKTSILKGVDPELDSEALKVINSLPAFENPGYKDGRPVSVWYAVPITFALK